MAAKPRHSPQDGLIHPGLLFAARFLLAAAAGLAVYLLWVSLSGGAVAPSRAAPVNIAFRIRTNASGADSVVDLQVEGVSMALTQRDEFSAFLAQHAGNIGLLTAELEARAARVHTGNSIAQSQVR